MFEAGVRDVRNQGVLLNGVNADPHALLDLCFRLLDGAQIMPYYFYMCDMIPAAEHWRVSVADAQRLQHHMMGYLPGFATPRIVCDVPFVGKRWVHQLSSYDQVRGISYWTKNYRTSIEAADPEALTRTYEYYDPIHTLPAEGQAWWAQQGVERPASSAEARVTRAACGKPDGEQSPHAATEDGLPQHQGLHPPPCGFGLHLPGQDRRPDHRRRRDRAHPLAGDPTGLAGRLDLAVPQRAHPGGGHRRRRAAAVPLPPGLADQARQDEVRPGAGGGPKLPAARRAITRDLALEGMPLERADAVAVRLLDLGYFRIGSDIYADTNGSFGLTTLEKRHVRKQQGPAASSGSWASPASSTASRSTTPRCWWRWTACADGEAAPSGCSPTSSSGAGATSTPRR